MISVEEAKSRILAAAKGNPNSESVSLEQATGRVLAESVLAPVSLPPFPQSAMDGYAFRFADIAKAEGVFQVNAEVPAGDSTVLSPQPGEAVRIFTGAQVPDGLDTVIMQERAERSDDQVKFEVAGLFAGANVRIAGEQIQEGAIAVEQGVILNAGTIGFLGSLGIQTVQVYVQPRMRIVVTGSEFAEEMADLEKGKIFESNGIMLQSALSRMGLTATAEIAIDDKPEMETKIGAAVEAADIVLVTGGVSVGEYDFTKPVLTALGFEEVFHKIKQKPGKPLLFMQKGKQFAFGLPGNPKSALVCFYEYVWPFLRAFTGHVGPGMIRTRLPLVNGFRRKPGRAEFLTGQVGPEGVKAVGLGQGSHMLKAFSETNCLIYLTEEINELEAGTWVEVHLLP